MARPSTRQQLVDYCLRSLGAPVVEINLDDDQIEDRVDEALQYYQEYHSDGIVRTFHKHVVTQQDYDNDFITIPENIIVVLRVLKINTGIAADMFNIKYQMFLNDLYGLRRPEGLVNYEMTKQYLGMIEMTLTGQSQQINFSRHMHTVKIHDDWKTHVQIGQYIIFEGYQTLNPETHTDIFNDMMFKRYLTALLKRQWGLNLLKFEGISLPGGVTLNGRAIYDDAQADIEKIEIDFELKYSFPPDFYCG